MKDPVNFLGQPDLTKCNIQEVVILTAEPDSTREANQIVVKILDSTYEKSDYGKVSVALVQIDKLKNVLILLSQFGDLFDKTLI